MTKTPAKITANASQAVAKMLKKTVFPGKFTIYRLLYIRIEKTSQGMGSEI